MKKLLLLCSAFLFIALGTTTFAQTNVTFSVDMEVWSAKGMFDSATDTVWLAGSMNDWSPRGDMLTETAEENVYEVTLPIEDGEYFYKFTFTNGTVQWEDNVDNRTLVVAGETELTAGTYYFDEQRGTYSGVETSVEFNVDMTLPIKQGNVTPGVTNIYVAGNFSDWQNGAVTMEDPDGDSTYTATVDTIVSGTTLFYKFIYSAGAADQGTWEDNLEGDDVAANGNRVYGVVDDDPGITRFWLNTNPNIQLGDGNIFFGVDMSVMEETGIYDPVVDSIQIRGGFNGWNDSNPDDSRMNQDFLDPDLWTIQIPFENAEIGAVQNFKYFVSLADTGDSWEDGYERPLSQGGGNRDVDFMASETQDGGTYFYDDVHPDWVVPEGTTLEVTFNVDMSPAADPAQQAVPFDPAEDEVYYLVEQPAFARVMGWVDSDTMTVLQLTDPDQDMVYSGTMMVDGPSWNAFEYRYIFRDVSEGSFTAEPSGFSDKAYRVRYAAMTGPRAFSSPYDMPQDVWTNQEDKSDQFEEQPAGWTTSVDDLGQLKNKFELSQNYPNPFNPSTVIKFAIPQTSDVSLKVYNILGQQVTTLIDREMKAGSYQIKFNASDLASGIYFYSIQAGNFTATKKMMLLK